MKLSSLFVTVAVAQKKLLDPTQQLKKLQGHINFVWDTWYAPVEACQDNEGQRDRFLALIDRVAIKYDKCGYFNLELYPQFGGPPAARKRRSEEGVDVRISKTDPVKATTQLGQILRRFAERYMTGCNRGKAVKHISDKATKRANKLMGLECRGK